jgi:serine protease Do
LSPAFTKTTPASIADLKSIEQRVKTLVSRVSPAVVAVEVGFGSGTGVVISDDGLVLTAGHVCGGPKRDVRFTFPNGKTAYGKTVGVDIESDTGLMKITSAGPWPHVPTGDLGQSAIGEWVLALGHPGGFDLQRSLVVRLGRIIRLAPAVVQTDCTISPGDSGGPLFDMYGRVIAIHSAISSSVADNFHVPITEFYTSWNQLVKTETEKNQARPPMAYFGARVSDDSAGCCLSTVDPGSPASNAGLKPGDFILKVDEREIRVSASFRRWIAEAEPGETLHLEVKRGGKVFPLDVKLQLPPVDSTVEPKKQNQER